MTFDNFLGLEIFLANNEMDYLNETNFGGDWFCVYLYEPVFQKAKILKSNFYLIAKINPSEKFDYAICGNK